MSKIITYTTFFLSIMIFPTKSSLAKNSLELIETNTENIKIYPNPIVDAAFIEINAAIDLNSKRVTIVFYNLLGKEVYRINQVKDHQIKISKDTFKTSGVYLYQLKIDEQLINTGKIIVK